MSSVYIRFRIYHLITKVRWNVFLTMGMSPTQGFLLFSDIWLPGQRSHRALAPGTCYTRLMKSRVISCSVITCAQVGNCKAGSYGKRYQLASGMHIICLLSNISRNNILSMYKLKQNVHTDNQNELTFIFHRLSIKQLLFLSCSLSLL